VRAEQQGSKLTGK
jgi:hypothetical protein